MKKIYILIILSLLVLTVQAADLKAGKNKARSICAACHGIDGNSLEPTFPKIAGQHSAYLTKSLKAYRDGNRIDPVMSPMATSLSDTDIENLAAYFASQQVRCD